MGMGGFGKGYGSWQLEKGVRMCTKTKNEHRVEPDVGVLASQRGGGVRSAWPRGGARCLGKYRQVHGYKDTRKSVGSISWGYCGCPPSPWPPQLPAYGQCVESRGAERREGEGACYAAGPKWQVRSVPRAPASLAGRFAVRLCKLQAGQNQPDGQHEEACRAAEPPTSAVSRRATL